MDSSVSPKLSPRILAFPACLVMNVEGKKRKKKRRLGALTLKGLIYNICDLFDERLQQQTIAAAGAISQR